jgi:serine/threonine protein kinase
MNRSFFLPLITRLAKIYFSNATNKEYEYKRTIFYTLKELGGVYIKFLQVLCTMHKFTDGWGSPKEFEVFNKVQTEPIDIYKYITKKENFSHIENTPFACGSFAQLYRGKLITGEIVAIKVLRPSISATLRIDLIKLRNIIRLFSWFLPKNVIDVKSAFDEFSRSCLLETDYDREISNMHYFGNLYKNHPYVVIPKVYDDFCNRNVIVQDYIEGPTLADIISNVKSNESLLQMAYNLTGSDIWTQIVIAGGEALRTAMTADYVFGDPHPGNIILLPQNKIAFVDFGIIANKPTSQEAFYLWTKSYYDILMGDMNYGKLLQTTYMCFCPDLANALRKCSISNDFIKSIADAVTAKAKNIYSSNFSAQGLSQNGHFLTVFTKFVDNKNALNINLDIRNFQLLKAMQSFLSSVTTIDNRYGNNNFSKIMIGCMKYALDYCEAHGVKNDLSNNTKYSINESYELLVDTLSSLAEGDEFLFQNISERMFL